ncbi:MAG: hypothetical protein ABI843_07655 [Dokdonella sp.]
MTLHLATAEVFPMTNDMHVPYERAEADSSRHELEWRTRYDGIVAIAHIGDKAVAGVSGPWSGKFALTWWERPLPARQLELFDTLEEAKREVEDWALRMRSGYPSSIPPAKPDATIATTPMLIAKPGLIGQVRALLPDFGRKRTRPLSNVERLRQQQAHDDSAVDDLHFAAND